MTDVEIEMTMEAISRGDYPDEPIVGIAPPFKNAAGEIWNLAWGGFGSASFITSNAGSVRSNHYHKEDTHFMYVTTGLMIYYFRPPNEEDDLKVKIKRRTCGPGTLVFTPPRMEHATYFPLPTIMVTLNKRRRDHASHESDLVRVDPLIRPSEICPAVLEGHKCILPFEDGEATGPFATKEPLHPIHNGQHMSKDRLEFNF